MTMTRMTEVDLSEAELERIFGRPISRAPWEPGRVTSKDVRRGMPVDTWMKANDSTGQLWHVVDAMQRDEYTAACGAVVDMQRTKSERQGAVGMGYWVAGHWPAGACRACADHVRRTRTRLSMSEARSLCRSDAERAVGAAIDEAIEAAIRG